MKDKEEPTIKMAMDIAQKCDKAIVIILTIESTGKLTMHSWGEDKQACQAAATLGDGCFLEIMEKFKMASAIAEKAIPAKEKLFTPRIITPPNAN